MEIEKNIKDYAILGDVLSSFISKNTTKTNYTKYYSLLNKAIDNSYKANQWFISDFVNYSIEVWGNTLTETNLTKWLEPYYNKLSKIKKTKKAGVVMPGNLPLAGLHDFLCVLVTGNHFTGKMSSRDRFLLPAIAEILCDIDNYFSNKIKFVDDNYLSDFDFIIATGSNNTSRYFEYYFNKYPNIIRKNRNGVAVLTGKESQTQLDNLAKDIFMYFGLGCRSISKIFVPENYNFNYLFKSFENFRFVALHNKYCNNYDFYKSIFLVNRQQFMDNGYILLKQENKLSSPVAVLYFDFYNSISEVNKLLETDLDKLQCICSEDDEVKNAIPFGKAQQPDLWNYADNIDTIDFILDLCI